MTESIVRNMNNVENVITRNKITAGRIMKFYERLLSTLSSSKDKLLHYLIILLSARIYCN